MMKKPGSVILMMVAAAAAFGADFGLVLGTDGAYAGNLRAEGFSVTAAAAPWFSAVLTETIRVYVSGSMAVEYAAQGGPPAAYFFEPERTELTLRPAPGVYLGLGRRRFGDPAGLIASGLFDGAGGSVNLGGCRLSLDAYYTGLLYKETANIIMTAHDLERYAKPLDAEGLAGYFASRRVLLAVTGEFPDVTSRMSLAAQVLVQLDVNDGAEKYNTQYGELRVTVEPAEALHISLGGIGELVPGAGAVRGSAAALAGADWEVSGSPADLLSAEVLWTGGNASGGRCAFTPVSGTKAGRIFDGGIGALLKGGLLYRVRPVSEISVEAGAGYFIRTDRETLGDAELDGGSDSRALGGELYGFLVWAPDSVFRFSAGGGAFFPGWGGAFREGAPVRWKTTFGLIVSL
jgi:hypothetical protein